MPNKLTELSVPQLEEITGYDRRTLRRRLHDLPPARRVGRTYYWSAPAALERVYATSDPEAARARLFAAQADKARMQTAALRRRLVETGTVRERVAHHMVEAKKRLAAISDRAGRRILAIPLEKRTLGQVKELLDHEVRAALTDLVSERK